MHHSSPLSIDGKRLWATLMELGTLGETPKGGSRRLALTDLDKQGRQRLIQWMEEAGLAVSWDAMGNIFGRRAGQDDSLAPIMMGSHIDTQPTGGKFDGCFGVIAGLEVIRTLNDSGVGTRAPLELAIWTNEEGARFVPTMMGSAVFANAISQEAAYAATDHQGLTVQQELSRIGFLGTEPVGQRPVAAYLEAHIEQGPILEQAGETIGVVVGVLGIRLINVTVMGLEAHAGPTPMQVRKDALYAAAPVFTSIIDMAQHFGEHARATIGEVHVLPNVRNTIPGQLRFSVDLRHLDPAQLESMVLRAKEICAQAQAHTGLAFQFEEIQYVKPTQFDEQMIAIVKEATAALGYSNRVMVSGAGHDACNMAKIVPTSMVFIPSKDGISHNEAEYSSPEHVAAGAQVLLQAVLKAAASTAIQD